MLLTATTGKASPLVTASLAVTMPITLRPTWH